MKLVHFGDPNRCPGCQSQNVRKSRRRNVYEKLFCAVFFLSPFRCEDCDERYFGFHPPKNDVVHHPKLGGAIPRPDVRDV